MSENLKLFALANKKAAEDSDFLAYFLKKYSEIERISEQELIAFLNCTLQDYYKLGLCRVPDISTNDFPSRLKKISEFANVSVFELNKIIKRVSTILKFSDNITNDCLNSFLMAARDKLKDR